MAQGVIGIGLQSVGRACSGKPATDRTNESVQSYDVMNVGDDDASLLGEEDEASPSIANTLWPV